MKSTGKTNPHNTGSMQIVHIKAADTPCNFKGCDSVPWRSTRALEKRKRDWARCSAVNKITTTAKRRVASCAAAMRLSITSHAL